MAKFYVVTKDRVVHKMGDKCNEIDYSDVLYLKCFNVVKDCWDNKKTQQVLRLFPHSEVKRIINVD